MIALIEQGRELIAIVTTQIEGQNWTDRPLTDDEKALIAMAVSATAYLYAENDGRFITWIGDKRVVLPVISR